MTQFVAYEPHVEVSGEAILSTVAGIGERALSDFTEYGLGNVQAGGWYPQQHWLNLLRAVAEGKTNSMFDLVAIGMKIPETAVFPPEIDSIQAALHAIDVAYRMNHRNGEIGSYSCQVVNDHSIDIVCDNPYPCDFDYGIIWGMARRFRPGRAVFTVRHDDKAPCRNKGGESCTYHVTWE